ncbi:MAG: DUF393 domain-containing protein [Verrucomicrobia bacterium]|nr:DUF393 domain-containing protein [Verrucomicrobiota bacterium]
MSAETVILFDAGCPLCTRSVQLIRKRARDGLFRYVPLDSSEGRRLLAEHGLADSNLDSLVLIENEKVYIRSTAALRIARRLRILSVLYVLVVLPRGLRDSVYDWIARNRHRWYGHCDDERCDDTLAEK